MPKKYTREVEVNRTILSNYNLNSESTLCEQQESLESDDIFNVTTNKSKTIAIVDFLNLTRKYISDRSDAKFHTTKEFIKHIKSIALHLKSLGNFHKIYLVTKWFRFNNKISHNDVIKIILWSFCDEVPEWKEKILLVLVNGLNDKDKESDDRALFILYNEFTKTTTNNCIIFSNDNFESIKTHFLRKVTLKFFFAQKINDSWQKSITPSQSKVTYEQNKTTKQNSYLVVHPDDGVANLITIN